MEDSPSKLSVAELAGRFKGHIFPMPTSKDELPFQRRPPCSLKLQHQNDDEESDKTISFPKPFKIKMNSPITGKLQANLALSPTALLPSPKSPEVKLKPEPLSPTTPCSQLSPSLGASHLLNEEEDSISFNNPPDSTPLPSFNKTRARLSFKRRPPTRQHRRSAGEEGRGVLSPCELHSSRENGDKDQVLESPTEEVEYGQPVKITEAEEKDGDCLTPEDELAKCGVDSLRDPEEEQVEQPQSVETVEEEQHPAEPCTVKQIKGDVRTEEEEGEMTQGELHGGNDQI
ncbi:capZ-interacting protein isoform X2 [Antennarius striatus]|uniref:capZ-interacting protein isoform X2 n=1 Tax=Antennarius striatus TaxID=241820 RepID=UPI0035B45579